jgi:penicillin-binding protein 1B
LGRKKARRYSRRRFRIVVFCLTLLSVVLLGIAGFLVYHTLRFTALIDIRLRGEEAARPTWVYARPFELRRGQRLSRDELLSLLNDLGYRQRPSLGEEPGSFALVDGGIHLRRRGAFPTPIAVSFEEPWISDIRTLRGDGPLDRVPFEPVPVATLFGEDRAKKRWVELEAIPDHVADAVLTTEDRRFFEHTGFDPVGIARALVTDLRRGGLEQGASTLTQQLVKNYFLTPERTFRRKLLEAYLAVILESRTRKTDILELYLNDVYLGQRGSFGIHGVAQAAQIFFGKDLKNLTVSEAALIAALIRSPNSSNPFHHPKAALERRNVVIDQMQKTGLLTEAQAASEKQAPLGLVEGAVDQGEAPYFIDALRGELLATYDAARIPSLGLRIQSTMDRHLQSAAQKALVEGLEEIQAKLPRGASSPPQAALVAMRPATGDVLALVGARSYGASQFNRATEARRQPGSAFKPFVYLAAFEHDPLLGPTSTVKDEPRTFRQGGRSWTPSNYTGRFEGMVSYRRALALSLNVATASVGERVGFGRVVDLWHSMGMESRIEPYPSLVLGSFEVTPLELATGYAVLAGGGKRVEPRFFTSVEDASSKNVVENRPRSRGVVSPESAYLVTDILRTAIDAGTGREIRSRGLAVDVAGKTGTTNDTRDAWFVGYTPELVAVVWVGYDDNRPLGLAGAEAALPIWARFMKAALAGGEKDSFVPPPGVIAAEIDPATGKRATRSCPRRVREVFRKEAAPREVCPLHG